MCVCAERMLHCVISDVFRGSLTRKVRASAKTVLQHLQGSLEHLATIIPLGWPICNNIPYVSQSLLQTTQIGPRQPHNC